nr:hypothetical protein [Rubripirellula sp.]
MGIAAIRHMMQGGFLKITLAIISKSASLLTPDRLFSESKMREKTGD